MKNVKNIKKNICKLEVSLNKLCKKCEIDDDENDIEDIDNIDKYIEKYCSILNSINDDNINSKSLEEIIDLLKELESMDRIVKSYQKSNAELNVINI